MKLRANGKSSTQPLTIEMDPRVNATAKALGECQLALASQLVERLGEVSAALQQANGLRKQIEERKKDAAGKTEILTALEELNQRTEAAAEPESEHDYFMLFGLALPASEQEPLPRVEFALTGLFVVTESADVAPASDLRKAAEAWDVASKNALARWKLVMSVHRTFPCAPSHGKRCGRDIRQTVQKSCVRE